MHTLVVALIGSALAVLFAQVARRNAVADRLRPEAAARGFELPRVVRAPLARALADAALSSTPEQAIEIWALAVGTAAIVGFGIAPAGGVIAGGGVLLAGPALLSGARQRRARLVAAAVPNALERVGAELRAGGTVATGLTAVARGEGPLAPYMARIETRVRLGASLSHALREWARERPAGGVDATAGAFALSVTVGGRAADALDALASSLRDRLAVAAEARALSAQARYSAWVIGVAPFAYMAAGAVIDPRSMHALIGTNVGRTCALAGVALEALGVCWMRAIVRAGDPA